MTFEPALQSRIDALRGGDLSDDPEVKALRAKIAARKGKSGYETNVKEIEARIAELTA
jgi:hypothetical protein